MEDVATIADVAGVDAAIEPLLGDEGITRLAGRVGSAARITARVPEPLLPLVLAAVHRLRADDARPALSIVVPDDQAARELAEAVRPYAPGTAVAYLPHRGLDHGAPVPPTPHLVGERALALDALAAGGIVAVSADGLVERLPPRGDRPPAVAVTRGQRLDRDDLLTALIAAGYDRVHGRVDDRATFSARGDVVDVFPTTGREPLRIEFFDDLVERVSLFSVLTQRSMRDLDAVRIAPAAESSRPPDVFAEETIVPDGLVPVVPELVAAGPLVVWRPSTTAQAARERLAEIALPPAQRRRGYLAEQDVADLIAGAHAFDDLPAGQAVVLEGQKPVFAARGVAEGENEVRALVRQGLRVVVAFANAGDADRTLRLARRLEAAVLERGQALPRSPGVSFVVSPIARGVIAAPAGVAVIPAQQVFRRRAAPSRGGRPIADFTGLAVGDFVVHEDHGIGRFAGFDTRTVAGVTRDYLNLDFRGDDKLFLPHEQIGKLSRYIGADARGPTLSKLGGNAWAAITARARHAVHELAGELLALYAARQTHEKEPVVPDAELMAALEAGFPYDETDDQQRAIEAVAEDLEEARPMDRLVCGDVGFGKTEVAVRAAGAVVSAGRQVLMLVPTTILCEQHFATFRDRFRDLPIRVEHVSRFRTAADAKAVVAGFRDGAVDILIGTHRVLSRDIVPARIGLVIVDEEQRFGVAQKETLRALRTEVDVLALSATPIPRTLHMSLAGLRDISVIATPPRGRRPIRTHVGEWDEVAIATAIRRERERTGQVLYLHNRVETIDEAAERVRELVPEARVTTGHGQMPERQLEQVMRGFLAGDQDVLVSTTIIESGLDIPTANTLIVERADLLGLAQLYQIRGRVGRSDVPAHAYLFYPDASELSEEARARLSTLADYTELGSGFKIAMRDLELRGAGNLLGDEQSGHVAAIGFELYCQLLGEAVAELQGDAARAARVVRVEASVDAYVPAEYVGLEAVKIEVHRRIALATTVDELRDLMVELADRFGPVPAPVENLIGIQELRLLLAEVGASAVQVRPDRVAITGVDIGPHDLRALREAGLSLQYATQRREAVTRPEPGEAVETALRLASGIVRTRTALPSAR